MTSTTARHDAPAGQPGSRRIGSLTAAIRREMAVGPLTRPELAGIGTVGIVAVVAAVLPVDWLVQVTMSVVGGTVLGTAVARRALPTDVRRSLEAFGFLGEWELDRAAALGVGPITTPDDARAWLDATPERAEDRWFRWEMALLADRKQLAADVADRIPDDTPYGRFERAYAQDRVRWMSGQASDLRSIRQLVETIGASDGPDRRHAEVALAVAEATELAAAGSSPLPPLVAVRERLPADLSIGRRYTAGLRTLVAVAAVLLAVLVPAAMTLLRATLGLP
jgi:hypothetical protein